jgi:Tfp pilus assembly protein PilP
LQNTAYLLAGILSVGAALLISLRFLGPSHAQVDSSPPAPATSPADTTPDATTGEAPSIEEGDAPPAEGISEEAGRTASELEGFLEPFIYDIVNRRDPFMPYSEYVPSDTPGANRPLTPAQRFDLDQLKLVGIMWDVKDPKAMFMDPDNEVIVLGRDEGIGNRSGYIAAIREGEVVVVEAIRRRGDIIYKTRVLRIER